MVCRMGLGKHSVKQALFAAALIGCCCSPVLAESLPRVADASGPRPMDRVISRAVIRTVEREHLSEQRLNDVISQRAFDQFLDALDPYKLFFTAEDYQEFLKHRDTLDNEISSGDTSFAYKVYKRLLTRLDERMPMVHEIIDGEFDFELEEQIVTEPDLIQHTSDPAELRDRWRKQIKLAFLSLRADDKTDEEIRERLHRRYSSVESYRKQQDVYELLETYLSCFTGAFDPHTSYLAPRTDENFEITMGLQLEGIGATLSPEDGLVTIRSLVVGGAAHKDGRLEVGDQIIAVGQENSDEEVDVIDMKLDDVVSLIRGPAGTKVRLTIQPKVGGESKVIEIERAKIKLEDSAARSEVIEHESPSGGKIRVGYIKLPSFYLDMNAARSHRADVRRTTDDLRAILKSFETQNIDVVVLDLAKNGGGSLNEAIDSTGLFIDQGPVVQVKGSSGSAMTYSDEDAGVAWDGPLVVKIDKMSASASEILAGAIKDYQRGLVVGDPATHGKGTVQTLVDVNQLVFGAAAREPYGALKLTIQQFYLPDGQSTQLQGVASDVVLPSLTANADIGEGDLDYALPAGQIDPQRHNDYGMVSEKIRIDLQQKSLERIAKSEEFDRRLRQIESFKQQKDEKYRSLRESDFRARREELDLEAEEEKQMNAAETPSDKVFEDDYYNREVLNIAADYVEALRAKNLAQK